MGGTAAGPALLSSPDDPLSILQRADLSSQSVANSSSPAAARVRREGSQRRSGQRHRLRDPQSFRLVLERRAAHKKVEGNVALAWYSRASRDRLSTTSSCSTHGRHSADTLCFARDTSGRARRLSPEKIAAYIRADSEPSHGAALTCVTRQLKTRPRLHGRLAHCTRTSLGKLSNRRSDDPNHRVCPLGTPGLAVPDARPRSCSFVSFV
jgi:hypothetical protein